MVVKVKIALQGREQIEAAGEVAGIDQFVFERAPQPFDKDIVEGSTTAIHADRDATLLERSQEFGGGELRAVVGVPNFGLTEAECGLERRQTEAGLQGVGEFPAEHEAAEPIHHRHEVEKAAAHRNVSNIGAPDLIGSQDFHATQQVRIHLVTRHRAA